MSDPHRKPDWVDYYAFYLKSIEKLRKQLDESSDRTVEKNEHGAIAQ